MMPLYDMMAQNSEAMKAMARQFGLSEAQVEQAMEALMPAFSTGLKRNASSPMDVGDFLQALAGGHHAEYFENMQKAFSPTGVEEGNGILSHIFGSKDVSRAVAAQAAAATGIGESILKQMLPVIASMVMGGLFKQSTGQMRGSSGGGSGNVIADIMTEMMKGGSAGSGGSRGSSNPLGQMLEGMLGGGMFGGQPSKARGQDTNPFADIFKQMMGGAKGPEPVPEPEPSVRKDNPYDQIFGQMFESGREIQRGYQKDMESIFDQYLQGMKRGQ
ncbi:MAG: hypothetical protein CML29_06260 [Rhizobiales bacterium]|nr:hypothetical protein [Hyphomicrobiales bacterium]MBA68196.1 hypothetical protein [Hyphomicrobiales bacterium]|tara:strand:+ start:548 stop:1366 length:819 start_codon:yes stop_codon:yes gene_type:complete